MKKPLQLLLFPIFLLLTSQLSFAQSTQVEFRVNMNEQIDLNLFNPNTEFVDLAGDFNNWGAESIVLEDSDSDGIYTKLVSLEIGETILFKARIEGEWKGREEFPGGGDNRSYTVVADGIVKFWYSDILPPDGLLPRIKVSSRHALVGELVQFEDNSAGDPVEWLWAFTGAIPSTSRQKNPIVSYAEEGEFSISLLITDSNGNRELRTFVRHISVKNNDTHWWNDAVFYQVFVRSFYDSDANGIGDFKGLTQKLDYLNDGNPATHSDLGVTGLWIMPMMQSPSYHGYDVTDYRTVEQDYGTNEDFKTFVAEAHKRGIKVIIDYVMNHTAYNNPWFNDARNNTNGKRNWYIWRDSNPNWTGGWGQNVWHPYNGRYYFGVFFGGMPDLNYYKQEVKDEMFDIAKFWLEDSGIDGFRLDAVRVLVEQGKDVQEDSERTLQIWRDFRTFYKNIKPDAFTVGEAWTSTENVKKYVDKTGIDYCFEFDLSYALIDAAQNGNSKRLTDQLEKVMRSYPYLQFGTFLTNHDMDRIMSVLQSNEAHAKLASDLLLTLPGIPYIYYGEEIGMTGTGDHENIRTPLQWDTSINGGFSTSSPWRSTNSDFTTKNIASQQANSSSLWQNYQQLIAIRNKQVALRRGNYKTLNANKNGIASFLRQHGPENIFVVSNTSENTLAEVSITSQFSNLPKGNFQLLDLLTGEKFSVTIDNSGGFENQPVGDFEAKSTKIFKLLETDATKANIEFQLDMSQAISEGWFKAGEHEIQLISSFDSNEITLADSDNDGIYTISENKILIGSTIQYKYKISNGNEIIEEFANSDYQRNYKIQEGENQVYDKYEGGKFTTITSLENELANKIQLYPNPAKNQIQLKLPEELGKKISYQIIGTDGKVHTQNASSNLGNPVSVRLSNLPNGLYLIEIRTEKGKATKRFTVDK